MQLFTFFHNLPVMDGFMTTIFCDKAFRIIYKKSHRHTSVILDVMEIDTSKLKIKI